jgi:hypothetical protein
MRFLISGMSSIASEPAQHQSHPCGRSIDREKVFRMPATTSDHGGGRSNLTYFGGTGSLKATKRLLLL